MGLWIKDLLFKKTTFKENGINMMSERWKRGFSLTFFLFLFILFPGIAGKASAQTGGMTLMIYMCGSNLESEGGYASKDIREMIHALPAGGNTQVLILASGSESWELEEIKPFTTGMYRLENETITHVTDLPSSSMGSSVTLSSFLEMTYLNYPADRYGLIIWDHGGGPMIGVCYDTVFSEEGKTDCLTLPELKKGLQDSPFAHEKLCFIGFDACLMASLETAATIADYADYMIASEEPESSDGWDYSFLKESLENLDAREIVNHISDSYMKQNESALKDVTISCIDLSRIEELQTEMDSLFDSLKVDALNYPFLAEIRDEARMVGSGSQYDYDLVDLVDLLSLYQEYGAAETGHLLEILSGIIISNQTNARFRNGLSIYYPFRNRRKFASGWQNNMAEIPYVQGYRSFVDRTVEIWLGKSLVDWDLSLVNSGFGKLPFTLQLSEKEADMLASARLRVVSRTPGMKGFRFVYASDDLEPDSNHLITTVYNNEGLFFLDETGQPTRQSDSLFYVSLTDEILGVPAMLTIDQRDSNRKGNLYDYSYPYVYLKYRKDVNGIYRFMDVEEVDGSEAQVGKSAIRMDRCTEIDVFGASSVPSYNEDGRLLPYKEWDIIGIHGESDLGGVPPEHAGFVPVQDGNERFAFFEITDLQGNSYASDMVPIQNENRFPLDIPETKLFENNLCSVTLLGVTAAGGPYPRLEFKYLVENHSDRELNIHRDEIPLFDGQPLDCYPFSGIYMNPREITTVCSAVNFEELTLTDPNLDRLTLSLECRLADAAGSFYPGEAVLAETVSISLHINLRALGVQSYRQS